MLYLMGSTSEMYLVIEEVQNKLMHAIFIISVEYSCEYILVAFVLFCMTDNKMYGNQ